MAAYDSAVTQQDHSVFTTEHGITLAQLQDAPDNTIVRTHVFAETRQQVIYELKPTGEIEITYGGHIGDDGRFTRTSESMTYYPTIVE